MDTDCSSLNLGGCGENHFREVRVGQQHHFTLDLPTDANSMSYVHRIPARTASTVCTWPFQTFLHLENFINIVTLAAIPLVEK